MDDFTQECLAVYVDTSISGHRGARLLAELNVARGRPQLIVSDNGSEFISRAMDRWAYETGVKLHFIRPGKPKENAFIESFVPPQGFMGENPRPSSQYKGLLAS